MQIFLEKVMTNRQPLYRVLETKRYRKDLKRMHKRGFRISKLDEAINIIAADELLPDCYHVHKLTGEYAGYEECHIEPDWLLIYRKEKDRLVLVLTQTGTHSDLFGL